MKRKRPTAKQLIEESMALFKKNGIEHSKLNAELIMAHCINGNRTELYSNYNKELTRIEENYFRSLTRRRLKREPVQYIVGETEFMSIPFKVNRYVLIPRPDTETLVEFVLNYCLENRKKTFKILDLGCGSGNIIISIAKYAPGMAYYGSDISKGALRVSKVNIKLNNIKENVSFVQSDGFQSFKKKPVFNCIVSNPPYIPSKVIEGLQPEVKEYEPMIALDGGDDGLDNIRNILDNAHSYLKKDGLLCFEIGYRQSEEVLKFVKKIKYYKGAKSVKDLSGKERVIVCYKK